MRRRKFLKIGATGSAAMMMPVSLFHSHINSPLHDGVSEDHISIKVTEEEAIISNQKLRKVIRYSGQQPMPVEVASLVNKEANKESLAGSQQSWFECVINNKLVKSSEKLWRYDDHKIQALTNGGKELQLIFQGARSGIKGLRIHIKQQVFPGSTLIREQITIKAIPGEVFHINKRDNKLHFIFPRYDLKADKKAKLTSTEFRMATWDKEILDDINPAATYDSRGWDGAGDLNLAMAHMFHPDIRTDALRPGAKKEAKGPCTISSFMEGDDHFLMTYEHASQDNLIDFDFSKTDGVHPPLKFLALHHHRRSNILSMSVDMLRGGYIDGDKIDNKCPFQSVWAATGFYHGNGLARGKKLIYEYLLKWIIAKPASRKLSFIIIHGGCSVMRKVRARMFAGL